jgi:hypothetical protein
VLLPEHIKKAAAAVTKCRVAFYESTSEPCGGPAVGSSSHAAVFAATVNDVIIWFCRAGLPAVLKHVEHAMKQASEELAPYQEIVAFFTANSAATEVRGANFDPATMAGRMFAELDEEALKNAESCDLTVTRKEATESLSRLQALVMALSEAKGALQSAIITVPPYRGKD